MRAYIGPQYDPRSTYVINDLLRKPAQAPNENDLVLYNDYFSWDTLVANNGLTKYVRPLGRPKYAIRPWIAMPAEGRRFKPIGILPLPVGPFTGDDIPIFDGVNNPFIYVPTGYDGVITDYVCEILPPAAGTTGFVEGSGDIAWRFAADGRFLRDLGNILVTNGSLTTPSPVPRGGLRVYSRNQLQVFVNLAVGADARLTPGARIVTSISGWFWPR